MRTSILSPLALALVSSIALLGACQCPEPHHPTPVMDSPEHVRNVEITIANAQARQVWTQADERAFSQNMAHMSIETRFAMGKRIAQLINSKAMAHDRTPPKTEPVPECPCGRCGGVPTPVAPASPAPATNMPPNGAQPGPRAK
jgi:hypothetical protein